jgi:hypothetical protein
MVSLSIHISHVALRRSAPEMIMPRPGNFRDPTVLILPGPAHVLQLGRITIPSPILRVGLDLHPSFNNFIMI